jgi:hypothetical protein
MKSNKKNGVTKETTRVYFGEFKEKDIKESFSKDMDEQTFLNAFRLLKTYEERKSVLELKNYELVGDDWEEKCGNDITKGDSTNFYFQTFTINKVGKVEKWVKRKSFESIKREILKNKNIIQHNPYVKFTVYDDKGNPQTFYKKK